LSLYQVFRPTNIGLRLAGSTTATVIGICIARAYPSATTLKTKRKPDPGLFSPWITKKQTRPASQIQLSVLLSKSLSMLRRCLGDIACNDESSCGFRAESPISAIKRDGSQTTSSRALRRFLHQVRCSER